MLVFVSFGMLDRVYAVETFIMDVTIPCVPHKYEKIENLEKSKKICLERS